LHEDGQSYSAKELSHGATLRLNGASHRTFSDAVENSSCGLTVIRQKLHSHFSLLQNHGMGRPQVFSGGGP